jgi:hypothetical protein
MPFMVCLVVSLVVSAFALALIVSCGNVGKRYKHPECREEKQG